MARIIREQRHFARIREHGLAQRRKLLLLGPPGDRQDAHRLAGELGLPLFQVRLDALISKFMGETTAKLRLIFDSLASSRAVYFFDEFDAIASQQGLGHDCQRNSPPTVKTIVARGSCRPFDDTS